MDYDNFDIKELEDFSPEEVEDDPEDINYENHRKHSQKHASNIHHQMQKMALAYSLISSTFERNLDKVHEYIKKNHQANQLMNYQK